MNFESFLKEKYDFNIKPQQRDAVLNITGPMLLLAVPGSGKTTVTALRCASLPLYSVDAPGILAIAHDSSSRDNLEARIGDFLGSELPKDLLVTTMVDFCGIVMKEYAELTGYQPLKQIEGGKRRLLRSLYAQINGGEYLPDHQLEDIAAFISADRHEMASGGASGWNGNEAGKINRVAAAYLSYMNTNHCIDYDEIQVEALAAFEEKPELLERFRARYPYINVDDAQELSRLQFMILKKLAAPDNNLFLAGDENQRLYTAACPECLSDFNRVYPQARMFTMERNFRSTHVIVDAANRLIRHNAPYEMNAMNTGNEIGMPVEETALAENGMLGSHILSRLKSLPNFGNAMIIYRDSSSAAAIAEALERERIPFRMRDRQLRCFNHWVAQDILAFMELAHDPHDLGALKRIYRKLNTHISKEVLSQANAAMANEPQTDALGTILFNSIISVNAAVRIRKLREDMANLPGMRPDHAIHYILEKLEYGEYLKKTCGKGMYLESLTQIVDNLAAIASHTASYAGLLERIGELNRAMESAGNSTNQDAVMLAPAHMAKGSEYKNVYIVDVCEGSFPRLKAIAEMNDGNRDPMETERRLFYVAITRAGKYVELIYSRKINGNRTEPSKFIRETLCPEGPGKARPGAASGQKPRSKRKHTNSAKRNAAAQEPDPVRPAAQPDFERFDLDVGTTVEHSSFGSGVISAYDDKRDIVAIRFVNSGLKKFSASYCMNRGVMRKASGEITGYQA